jgi:hypothetical protein
MEDRGEGIQNQQLFQGEKKSVDWSGEQSPRDATPTCHVSQAALAISMPAFRARWKGRTLAGR